MVQAIINELNKIRKVVVDIKTIIANNARTGGDTIITIPEKGGSRSFFGTGKAVIDFTSGTIVNPDGSVDSFQTVLKNVPEDYVKSFSIYTDVPILISFDGQTSKKTVRGFTQITNITFQKLTIETTSTSNISIFASTNKDTNFGYDTWWTKIADVDDIFNEGEISISGVSGKRMVDCLGQTEIFGALYINKNVRFTIGYSSDGVNWDTYEADEFSGRDGEIQPLNIFVPIYARYIEIVVKCAYDNTSIKSKIYAR